jgi:hypothetical protein
MSLLSPQLQRCRHCELHVEGALYQCPCCLHSSRSADIVRMQHCERHVLPGARRVRHFQPGPTTRPGQPQQLHIHEAAGSGEYPALCYVML